MVEAATSETLVSRSGEEQRGGSGGGEGDVGGGQEVFVFAAGTEFQLHLQLGAKVGFLLHFKRCQKLSTRGGGGGWEVPRRRVSVVLGRPGLQLCDQLVEGGLVAVRVVPRPRLDVFSGMDLIKGKGIRGTSTHA